jgi:hypothetical protein
MKCSSPSVSCSRLADQRLAAQQVEVLGSGGRVGDADVALGAEGEEALDAGTGVLRAGALVPVRQQHGEAAGLAPLRLAGDDEAVDDYLGGVGEVAELRLPEDQRARARRRVAVLEAEAGDLRERAVVELEGCRGVLKVLHRRVLEAGVLVVEDEVAVGEGAALGVLAGEADVDAVGQQRAEGERLGLAEVDPALLDRLHPPRERAAQLAVDVEAVGGLQQLLVELAQLLGRDGGVDRRAGGAVEQFAGAAGGVHGRVLVLAGLHLLAQLLQRRRHLLAALLGSVADVLGRDRPLADQLLGVDLRDRRVGFDLRRHGRLRVGRLVGLVVAEAAVADHVDDDVAAPALAVGHRQPYRRRAGLDVVGVDVDDRHVESLCHVRGVGRRARLLGIGGEADLVVLDDVDRAAGAVALQRLQVERLGDDPLGGEGGVAVQQHRHGAFGVMVQLRALEVGLQEAGAAGDDRVDELEVAGIGVEADRDLLGLGCLVDPTMAVVVLDVAGRGGPSRRRPPRPRRGGRA